MEFFSICLFSISLLCVKGPFSLFVSIGIMSWVFWKIPNIIQSKTWKEDLHRSN
jgi:hypothetical protein